MPLFEFRDRTTGARATVIHGDAFALLEVLPDGSFDHAITDPPYAEHVHANAHSVWNRNDGVTVKDKPIGFDSLGGTSLQLLARHLPRVARRWALAFCDLESLGDYKRAAGGHTAQGGTFVRSWIWVKGRSVPQLSGDRPGNRCEGIAVLHRAGPKRWNGHGKHAYFPSEPADVDAVLASGDDVLGDAGSVYSQIAGRDRIHQTQKPPALLQRLLAWFTDQGETILDPFAGSCSLAVEALPMGRNVLCCEANPEELIKAVTLLRSKFELVSVKE